MHSILGACSVDGKVIWQVDNGYGEDGLAVVFTFFGREFDDRKAIKLVTRMIEENTISWIRPSRVAWQLDVDQLKAWFNGTYGDTFLSGFDWLEGVLNIDPVVKHDAVIAHPGEPSTSRRTTVRLCVYREDYELNKAKRLFLSHKRENKPLVQHYFNVLKGLGFDPWLDDDAMPAGTKLHRGIQDGLKDSCAAIFFITPEFKDDGYLAKEIDYAIAEENTKGVRFKIIALVLTSADGQKGIVPSLLEPYVWTEPKTDLEALLQIIKAVPLEVGPVTWKPGT